jgi:hypothetical protein
MPGWWLSVEADIVNEQYFFASAVKEAFGVLYN